MGDDELDRIEAEARYWVTPGCFRYNDAESVCKTLAGRVLELATEIRRLKETAAGKAKPRRTKIREGGAT